MNTLFDSEGATFSADRKYRYVLWRVWDISKPVVAFIGLNPSTANETQTDATITRVKAIAEHNGYGGIYMLNLFAIVSRDPTVLKTCEDPIADNDKHLELFGKKCKTVVFAWGNFKEAKERSKVVIAMFPEAMALHINKNGSPKHPLYCLKTQQLVNFDNH